MMNISGFGYTILCQDCNAMHIVEMSYTIKIRKKDHGKKYAKCDLKSKQVFHFQEIDYLLNFQKM